MAKLNEFAQSYEPLTTTKNIADLPEVSVDMDLEDDSFKFTDKITGKEKTVTQKVITVKDEKYRVPNSVLKQLKVLLEDNSDIKAVKVKKTGEGLKTTYTVIPVTKP